MLSPGAIEVLLEHADLVVEGGEELGGRRAADRRFYATVMVTLELARCASFFRERADEATARRVAELMDLDAHAHQRLRTLAARELAQLADVEPDALAFTFEAAFRVDGTAVLVDIDVVATPAQGRG